MSAPSEETPQETPQETPHASPRSLRVMALVRWALLAAVAAIAVGSWWTLYLAPAEEAGVAAYYCPMHPDITSPRPGTCPICHMSLELIPEHATEHATEHAAGGASAGGHAHADPAAQEGDGSGEGEAHAPMPGEVPSGTQAVMLAVERVQRSGLVVVPARRAELSRRARWPATVEALEGARAEVRVRAMAFVEESRVRELGVSVRRGQTLGSVSSPEILAAEQELLTVERLRTAAGRPESDPLLAAARRRLELLGVTPSEIDGVLRAGQPRRRIALRAPIAGVITRLEAVVGTTATPDTVLFEVTSYEEVRVVASVFDRQEAVLASEGSALFAEHAGGEGTIPLRFDRVESELASGTRATRVRFTLDNRAAGLRPGAIGDVVIDAGSAEAVLAPRDAILDRGTEPYVFVQTEPGLFVPRVVRTGRAEGDEREVLEGLVPGERVVQRGAFLLDSESRLSAALSARAPTTPAHDHAGEEPAP